MPLLFNLRRDPFEKAQHNSNTYNDWFLDRVFVIAPDPDARRRSSCMTMKDYPPSQTPGSFNLAKMQKQIEDAPTGRTSGRKERQAAASRGAAASTPADRTAGRCIAR